MFKIAGGIIIAFTLIALLKTGKKLLAESGGIGDSLIGLLLIITALAGMAFVFTLQ